MKYKINEIFYSIQGEGYYTGTPAVFVRFSGCNLSCDFCDTPHESFTEYTKEQLIKEIGSFNCHFIIFTGGEPMLQLNKELLHPLKDAGFYLAIETNGTIEIPRSFDFDWITVSPKFGWIQKEGSELKVVYKGQDLTHYHHSSVFDYYYLQPCSMKNIKEVIAKVKENPKWNLSIQIQKLLKIR